MASDLSVVCWPAPHRIQTNKLTKLANASNAMRASGVFGLYECVFGDGDLRAGFHVLKWMQSLWRDIHLGTWMPKINTFAKPLVRGESDEFCGERERASQIEERAEG